MVAVSCSGLFENRQGWTIQLHDSDGIYEINGSDFILDLIGEIEVPSEVPHNIAPFLVTPLNQDDSKQVSGRAGFNRDTPHRPDIEREVFVDTSEPEKPPTDFASSILLTKENLRSVPKNKASQELVELPSSSAQPSLMAELAKQLHPRNRKELSRFTDKGDFQAGLQKAPALSRHELRPEDDTKPAAISRKSLMNRRYLRTLLILGSLCVFAWYFIMCCYGLYLFLFACIKQLG